MAGMGLGGLLWGLILPNIVASHGWAGGMRTLGLAAFVFLVLPGIFLIRNPPTQPRFLGSKNHGPPLEVAESWVSCVRRGSLAPWRC